MMKLTGLYMVGTASVAVISEVEAARFNTKPSNQKKVLRRLATATGATLLSQGVRASGECGDMCKEVSKAYESADMSFVTSGEEPSQFPDAAGGGLILAPGVMGQLLAQTQVKQLIMDMDDDDSPTTDDDVAAMGAHTGGFMGWDVPDAGAEKCVTGIGSEQNPDCTPAVCKKICATAKNGKNAPCKSYYHGKFMDADTGKENKNQFICALSTGDCTEYVSAEEAGVDVWNVMEPLTVLMLDALGGDRRLKKVAGESEAATHLKQHIQKLAHGKDATKMLSSLKSLKKRHSASKQLRRLDSEEDDGLPDCDAKPEDCAMPTEGVPYTKAGEEACSGAFSARNLAPAVALVASVVGVASAVAGM